MSVDRAGPQTFASQQDHDNWTQRVAEEQENVITVNGSDPSVGTLISPDGFWDAKGDLAVGLNADHAQVLPVGTDGYVLTADSASTLGVKWDAAGGGGGGTTPLVVASKSSNYSMSTTDDLILCTAALTLTLPDATTATKKFYMVKRTGSGTVTVATLAGTIDGSATAQILRQYVTLALVPDGTNWNIV